MLGLSVSIVRFGKQYLRSCSLTDEDCIIRNAVNKACHYGDEKSKNAIFWFNFLSEMMYTAARHIYPKAWLKFLLETYFICHQLI